MLHVSWDWMFTHHVYTRVRHISIIIILHFKMWIYAAGLHVIVIMFTSYLVGNAFIRSQLGGSPVLVCINSYDPLNCFVWKWGDMGAVTNSMLTLQHDAGGILGMVIGMLVETLLFIIRTSDFDSKKGQAKKTRHGSRYKKDQ